MKKKLYIGPATYEGETKDDIPHGYGYLMIKHEFDSYEGELSTPTGIAILTNLVNSFQLPYKYSIESYGVGIGNNQFPFPNNPF